MHQHQPAASQPGGMSASPLITRNAHPGGTRTVNLHSIRFTGSGSEYFRIWIVNLLLMIVTLGLYYPWAKVRKLRYFYGNTVVAGYPLDFHGNPLKMLRGFLLVSVLMILYSVAGRVSPGAGGFAGLVLAVIWPALIRASMQFRLANTSWRGLRFAFKGSLKDAYMIALMPMLIVIGVVMLAGIGMAMLPKGLASLAPIVFGALMFVSIMALSPYVWWRLKAYQHNHYALGQLQTSFKAGYAHMLGVFIRSGLIGLGSLLVGAIAMGMLISAAGLSASALSDKKAIGAVMAVAMPVFVGMFILAQLAQVPYFVSRMQNLVWTQTGNRLVRFKSHLALRPLMWVTFKNWALTILTLGFYAPFATVAMARIKLEAIVIHSRLDPDTLVAQAQQGGRDAAGDFAADLMGIDVGI
ncbi:MAG: YjgN family protein [Aquabacterium sp.]